MEFLDIFDEKMQPIGRAEREIAHRDGLIHQVVHVWILSKVDGETALVFQQRAFDKKDFPGYYDIAVGGHVGAGEEPLSSALREMREEVGLELTEADLEYCGVHRDDCHVGAFDNREFAHVYLYRDPAPHFQPGPEVERMVWVKVSEYKRKLEGAASIAAQTEKGETVIIHEQEWCGHHDEAQRFVMGAVKEEM